MTQTYNNRQHHDIRMAQAIWMQCLYRHLYTYCITQNNLSLFLSIYSYDGADRLLKVTDPLLGESGFSYDANGNRESQTDANLNTTTHEYDDLDRKTATVYPDTARQEYGYDENGNLTRLLDPKGQEIFYQYDELNRETLRSYPLPAVQTGDDIQTIATGYDPNNNPLTITETYSGASGTRVTTNSYDHFDRLTGATDPFGKTVNYTYDANGNRLSVKDPDSNITNYSYDALNRVSQVTNSAGVTSYSYDRSSLKTRVSYPNGSEGLYSYDDAYRTETITNRQNGTVISSYAYTFDDNGNRKTQIETNGGAAETTTYNYDHNDRLQQVIYPDVTTGYTYDAAYNRKTEISTDNATSTTLVDKVYDYDDRNQLETVTDNLDATQNVTYQYDDNGNQVIKTKNGVTNTFIYDVRDRLIELRQDAATLGNYFYDYKGMRVIKTDAAGEVRYTYDGDSVLTQSDDTGVTIAKYDYGPDRLLSLNHATEGRQFYLFDALGSTVNLTRPDGSIQARYQYDAWGHYRSQTGSSWNRFAFTGHEKDEESGLYYFKARYYDPDTGRFLSQDPYLGEAGTPPSLHRYLYAYGNPTVYIDLTGYLAQVNEDELNRVYESAMEGKSLDNPSRDLQKIIHMQGLGEGLEKDTWETGSGVPVTTTKLSSDATVELARIIAGSARGENLPTMVIAREADESVGVALATAGNYFGKEMTPDQEGLLLGGLTQDAGTLIDVSEIQEHTKGLAYSRATDTEINGVRLD